MRHSPKLADTQVDICTGLLTSLHNRFEGAWVRKSIELLDHLHVTVGDVGEGHKWISLFLDVVRSSEGT